MLMPYMGKSERLDVYAQNIVELNELSVKLEENWQNYLSLFCRAAMAAAEWGVHTNEI